MPPFAKANRFPFPALLAIGAVLLIATILAGCVNPVSSQDEVDRDLDRPQPEPADITDPGIGPYETSPTWTWDSDPVEGTTVFRYRLNGGDWMIMPAGPPPYTYTPATDLYPGTYVLEVQERNVAGIWSESSSQTITILVQPPTIPTGPAALSNDPVPSFQWAQGAPLQFGAANRFDWRLERRESGEWALVGDQSQTSMQDVVSYTVSSPLPDGEYRFGVAEWNSGGPRSEFVWHPFTVDATPPAAPVVSGPAAVSEAAPWQTYTWESDPADSFGSYTWELRNASDAVVDSATGVMTPTATIPSGGVTPPAGTYSLRVTHIDAAGNASSPGVLSIVVEQAPGLSYLGSSPTNDNTPDFSVTGLNQTNLINEFQWVIDDIPEASTFSNGGGEMWQTFAQSCPSLSDGTHAIKVQQRRNDGSYADPSAAVSVEIDTVAPTTPSFSATPPPSTTDTQPDFTVQSGETGVEFTYSVSGATTAGPLSRADAGADGVETITLPVLNPGSHTITVRTLDAAGNQSGTTSFSVTILETYTVAYNANGATGGSAPSTQTKTQGVTLTLATNSGGLTRTGYTFTGWNTNSAGTGDSYGAGGLYYVDASITLYAEWSANTYAVTLNQQSGGGGTTSVTATYDAAMPAATAPTRTGYTFGGYYTGTGGSGTQYYTNTMASARAWNITSPTTLYARWTAINYTVTLNPDGGGGGTGSVSATYGSAMPAATAPTRTGHTFGGFYTGTGGTGTQYYTNTMASARAWDIAGPTTLYARWTANTYTVTLDKQSGTGGTMSFTVTYGTAPPTITPPTRTGYGFGGYYTSTAGGGTWIYTGEPVAKTSSWSIASNTTLYAYWVVLGSVGPGGGRVFYDKGSYSSGWRFLEAAPSDQSTGLGWGGYGTAVGATGTAIGTGSSNTGTIYVSLGLSGVYAARICRDLNVNGDSDWFLPSIDELAQMYTNRTQIGTMAAGSYWSSSENSDLGAEGLDFTTGTSQNYGKSGLLYVRAARKF